MLENVVRGLHPFGVPSLLMTRSRWSSTTGYCLAALRAAIGSVTRQLLKKDRLRYEQTISSRNRAGIIVCIVLGCLPIPFSSLGESDKHARDHGPIPSQPL